MVDAQNDGTSTAAAEASPSYTYQKRDRTRWWEVRDPAGEWCA